MIESWICTDRETATAPLMCSSRSQSKSLNFENHCTAFALLQFTCFSQRHHYIQSAQWSKGIAEQIGSPALPGKFCSRDLLPVKSAGDYFGRFQRNYAHVEAAAIVGRHNEVAALSLQYFIAASVSIGPS